MRRWNLYLAITFALLIGSWGCSRSAATSSALTDRIQSLEARTIRLDEDFRAAAGQRDQFKKKLAAEEESRAQLQLEVERLQVVVKELNDVKGQLATRTMERDHFQSQMEGIRTNLKSLLGQVDTALAGTKGLPVIPTSGTRDPAPIEPIGPSLSDVKEKAGL